MGTKGWYPPLAALALSACVFCVSVGQKEASDSITLDCYNGSEMTTADPIALPDTTTRDTPTLAFETTTVNPSFDASDTTRSSGQTMDMGSASPVTTAEDSPSPVQSTMESSSSDTSTDSSMSSKSATDTSSQQTTPSLQTTNTTGSSDTSSDASTSSSPITDGTVTDSQESSSSTEPASRSQSSTPSRASSSESSSQLSQSSGPTTTASSSTATSANVSTFSVPVTSSQTTSSELTTSTPSSTMTESSSSATSTDATVSSSQSTDNDATTSKTTMDAGTSDTFSSDSTTAEESTTAGSSESKGAVSLKDVNIYIIAFSVAGVLVFVVVASIILFRRRKATQSRTHVLRKYSEESLAMPRSDVRLSRMTSDNYWEIDLEDNTDDTRMPLSDNDESQSPKDPKFGGSGQAHFLSKSKAELEEEEPAPLKSFGKGGFSVRKIDIKEKEKETKDFLVSKAAQKGPTANNINKERPTENDAMKENPTENHTNKENPVGNTEYFVLEPQPRDDEDHEDFVPVDRQGRTLHFEDSENNVPPPADDDYRLSTPYYSEIKDVDEASLSNKGRGMPGQFRHEAGRPQSTGSYEEVDFEPDSDSKPKAEVDSKLKLRQPQGTRGSAKQPQPQSARGSLREENGDDMVMIDNVVYESADKFAPRDPRRDAGDGEKDDDDEDVMIENDIYESSGPREATDKRRTAAETRRVGDHPAKSADAVKEDEEDFMVDNLIYESSGPR